MRMRSALRRSRGTNYYFGGAPDIPSPVFTQDTRQILAAVYIHTTVSGCSHAGGVSQARLSRHARLNEGGLYLLEDIREYPLRLCHGNRTASRRKDYFEGWGAGVVSSVAGDAFNLY